MEESTEEFVENIRIALNEKLKYINEIAVGNIKTSVPEYRENLTTLISGLFNAGLIEKDLYKSTQLVHELKLPSMAPIEPSQKDAELSFRLYDYLKQFEYIEKDLNYSMEQLTIEQIEDLITFFNYINWSRLSQTAASPVESLLSKIEQTIRNSENPILAGIFRDSRSRLGKLEKCILSSLEDIQIYLEENYKLSVRNRAVRTAIMDSELEKKRIDEALLIFKKQVKVEMGEVNLHSNLLKSILEEDYSENSGQIKEQTLKRIDTNLTVIKKTEPKKKKEKKEDNSKLLMEGFKILSSTGSPLIEVSKKLTHNADIIETVEESLIHKIICFLMGKNEKERCRKYDVVVFQAGNETGQRIKIDLDELANDLTKTGYKLLLLGNRNSKTYLSLLQLSEKRSEEILSRYIENISLFLSKLPALDLYMKNNSSNAMRANMKGFKLDLNDIHSCLNKANKRRLEYASTQIPAV